MSTQNNEIKILENYVNDAVELLKRLIATPRVSRDETAAADIMEQTIRDYGHHLRDACGRHALVCVFLVYHLAALLFHQNGRGGFDVYRVVTERFGRGGAAEELKRSQQCKQHSFHGISLRDIL